MPPAAVTYRRSPHVVSHWAGDRLVFHNFATGSRITANPVVTDVLHVFDDWRTVDALIRALPRFTPAALRKIVTALARHTFLQRSDRPPKAREAAMAAWSSWNPAAGFLHFSTQDNDFATGEPDEDRVLRERLRVRPPPDHLKPFARRRAVRLPGVTLDDDLARALRERRTWRRFSDRPLSLDDLGTLLGLTFGVHDWLDLGALGRAPLKTSPSGGARHPIEAYVVARRVGRLKPGLYYYAPAAHCLAPIRHGATDIERYLPGQWWYREASVLVVLTAVFARTEWQYPYARSYRAVLLEAGHFCQTFCLVATALHLAPFCSDALADTRLERDLKIDGVSESVLYAAGVGVRRKGAWTAWPDEQRRPRAKRRRQASG
jgi:SagB-type dehydrogenase family enzyme